LDPEMLTTMPPAVEPEFALTPVTPGAAAVNVNRSAVEGADVPLGVVTVTSTRPPGSLGDVAVICVAELTT